MPNARSKGQTLIGCWCDEEFVDKIDDARGITSRSQFARDALVAKLKSMGIHVPVEKTKAPDRAGKGGPRKRAGLAPEKAENPADLVIHDPASGVHISVEAKSIAGTNSKKVSDAARASKKRAAKIAGVAPKEKH